MIKIGFTRNGASVIPERELTKLELKTVTSQLTHGGEMTITYFQGDEPIDNGVYIEQPVKSDFMKALEGATDEEWDFLAKKLMDKLK